MMPAPYSTAVIPIGILNVVETPVAYMPRRDYLALVDEAIRYAARATHADAAALRDRLLPTARTMDRFALDDWISMDRGCGCLVGEYLVAADVLDRGDFLRETATADEAYRRGDYDVDRPEVRTYLARIVDDVDVVDALEMVGEEIDALIEDRLLDEGARYTSGRLVEAVVFLDDDDSAPGGSR
jgi:hypothetical protein